MFLALTVFCSMMLTVAAQANNSASGIESWKPPVNFVDPVTLKIQEFKSQGLVDEEITAKLAKLGMGWYPETGATWLGQALTPEELAKMPVRAPIKAPSGESALLLSSSVSCMRTNDASWTGVASEVVSGSMSVASGQTKYHYLCVQLGNLDSQSSWVEIMLTHNYGEAYKWCTYDSDEDGGLVYYMNKNTPTASADTYTIMLDGTQDGGGWHYDVWINYNWVRRGHLPNLWVQAGFQKEVFSDTGSFTNDASHSVFYRNWLHSAQGWPYWTNAVNTWSIAYYPVQQSLSMGALSYRWETWVQN
jgi:hypothetical protein